MNPLEARRRLLGRNVYKRTTEGNPAIATDSLARMYPGITMQGWTTQDGTPTPETPVPIVSAVTQNQETGKWDYEITITNAQTDPDKNQTVLITSDRSLTKWDKLEKRDGQWGWVYKSGVNQLTSDMFIFNNEGTFEVPYFAKVDRNRREESLSTHFIYKLSTTEYGNFWFDSGGTGLRFRMSQFQTAEEVKDWLQENEVYFAFPNAEETFVPLTAAEQEQMNALHTYRPTTVLSNDAGCNMELTYKTKKSLEVAT